ncbi:MAG TPA: pyridoxal phosphate-dependent aminotransferase [bacterium]|nr:pyridoxal phosphate-dependent aminotransferase [bacterium]
MNIDFATHFIPEFRRSFRARDDGGPDRRRYHEIAAGLSDVIALNSGDPDLTAAPAAVDAAIDALRRGKTHYVFGGLPELRAAIVRKLRLENGVIVPSEHQVIVTNGSAEAATAVFQTLLEPGDEVLTTIPYYGGHVGAIKAARGIPVTIPTNGDRLWEPDPGDVDARITPKTKAFIFANPGNPTAAVYRRETLEALLDIARRRRILMIADELFERYVYDGHRHVSMASLPESADWVVTINGFSKSYCMTGWRLGWVIAPPWLLPPLDQMRYAMSMAAASANQWGGVAALSDAARPYYDEVHRTYGERRAFFLKALGEMGLAQRPTPGAFVGMLDVRKIGRSSAEMWETILREARIAMSSGGAFGPQAEGWLRYSLIQPFDRLREAASRLAPVVRRLLTDAGYS